MRTLVMIAVLMVLVSCRSTTPQLEPAEPVTTFHQAILNEETAERKPVDPPTPFQIEQGSRYATPRSTWRDAGQRETNQRRSNLVLSMGDRVFGDPSCPTFELDFCPPRRQPRPVPVFPGSEREPTLPDSWSMFGRDFGLEETPPEKPQSGEVLVPDSEVVD